MTNKIKFDANNTSIAYVSKSFMNKALTYGTEEYKLLKEFRVENPDVSVKVKTIKKNPNKDSYKNLTFENMIAYIGTLPEVEEFLEEFEVQKVRSKIAKNPYRYMLNWFSTVCFADNAEYIAYKNSIANVEKTTAIVSELN